MQLDASHVIRIHAHRQPRRCPSIRGVGAGQLVRSIRRNKAEDVSIVDLVLRIGAAAS